MAAISKSSDNKLQLQQSIYIMAAFIKSHRATQLATLRQPGFIWHLQMPSASLVQTLWRKFTEMYTYTKFRDNFILIQVFPDTRCIRLIPGQSW